MLPNRSAGASGFGNSGISLEPYLFLSASRPSGPLYSPIVGWPQNTEIPLRNPIEGWPQKRHFRALFANSRLVLASLLWGLNTAHAIRKKERRRTPPGIITFAQILKLFSVPDAFLDTRKAPKTRKFQPEARYYCCPQNAQNTEIPARNPIVVRPRKRHFRPPNLPY